MTGNQLKYASLLEDTRHNQENEKIGQAQVELQRQQVANQKASNIIDAFTNATTVGKGIDTILKWFNIGG